MSQSINSEKEVLRRNKILKRKRTLKIVLVIWTIIWVFLVCVIMFWKLVSPDIKSELVKYMSKQQVVRNLVADEVKDDYEEKVQDNEFDVENVVVNEMVEKKFNRISKYCGVWY